MPAREFVKQQNDNYNSSFFVQEIKNSGAIGYKYISVDEDEAANVVYANYTLLHLGHEQIPKGSAVYIAFHSALSFF